MHPLKTGFGVTAIITGAISFLVCFIPGLNVFGFFIAVVAVVFGSIAVFNKDHKTGFGAVGAALGLFAIVIGLVVNVLFFAVIRDGIEPVTPSQATTQTNASPSATSTPSTKAEPSKAAPSEAKPKTEAPKATASQKNALRSAEGYLKVAPFSKKGLENQLDFEGFTPADAKWATDQLKVDWNNEAVKAAKLYLDVKGFSHKGLVDQLVFSGYTKAQAEHGASKVGL